MKKRRFILIIAAILTILTACSANNGHGEAAGGIEAGVSGTAETEETDSETDAGNSSWKVEGFARYFSYKYDRYYTDYLNYSLNRNKVFAKSLQEYIDAIGRPIEGQKDFIEWDNIKVHARGETDPDASYESGSSFIGYLVDQYGEQAVIAYVCSKDEYNADLDKSYDELVREWKAYIRKNYAQYSADDI